MKYVPLRKYVPLHIAVGATVVALSVGAATAKDLTYNTYLGPADVINTVGAQPMFDKIAKATNGEATFKIFPGGQLASAVESLNAVRDGIVDSAFVYEGYKPKQLPYSSLFGEMVALNRDSAATVAALMETRFFNCPECLDEFTKNNAITIVGHATEPGYIMCTREINSIKDLEGLRIRGPSRYQAAVGKAFGGIPVNIAFNEVVSALQQGSVDCVLNGANTLEAYGLAGIVKSVITTEHVGSYVSGSTFTIRLDLWNSFSDDVKKAIIRAAPDFAAKATIAQVEQGRNALKKSVANGKVKAVDLGDDFRNVWNSFLATERDSIIAAAKARNVANPEPLLDAYLKNLSKWAAIAKEADGDADKFSQKMWEEIYSKLKL